MIALTSGALAGLAGCTEGTPTPEPEEPGTEPPTDESDDGPGAVEGTPPSGTPVTTTISKRVGFDWNPNEDIVHNWTPKRNVPWWSYHIWREELEWPTGKHGPVLVALEDVSTRNDGCEVVATFEKGYTWWDGTPVTAADYQTQKLLEQYRTYGSPDAAPNTYEIGDDEYTLVQKRSSPLASSSAKFDFQGFLRAKDDFHGDWLEMYQDAGGESGVDEVTQQIADTEITLEDFVDEGLGCGLWKPDSWTANEVTHVIHEDHPRASWTNLEELVWKNTPDNQKARQALNNGEFDIGSSLLNTASSSDQVEIFREVPVGGMPKAVFNFRNKHLARRSVRRAIAYLLDHDEARQVAQSAAGRRSENPGVLDGMPDALSKSATSSEFRNSLIDYGYEAKEEEARQAMQDGGYSLENGVWVGPDGDSMTGIRIASPPWPSYIPLAKYVSGRLNEFGIETETFIEPGQGWNRRWRETYAFDIAVYFLNAKIPAQAYHPQSATGLDNYQAQVADSGGGDGCSVDLSAPELANDFSEKLQHPIRVEFPTEVGSTSMSGDTQTSRPIKWWRELRQVEDPEQIAERTEQFAWFYNWQVPHVPLYEDVWSHWGDTDNYHMPDGSHAEHWFQFPLQHLTGHINARTE